MGQFVFYSGVSSDLYDFGYKWVGKFRGGLGMATEVALITPPVGLNVFVVHGVTKVPLHEVFRGILPFVIMMFVGIILLFVFPQIITYLPGIMS
jgi:TRAP-type C4-dicarboxylate transport system permease large subunit